MDRDEVSDIARVNGLGSVYFEFRIAKNTGQEFEVGYVSRGRERSLFCKRGSNSNPDQFYLCNEYAALEELPIHNKCSTCDER